MWNFLVSFEPLVVRRNKAKAALRALEVSLWTMLDKNMELKLLLIPKDIPAVRTSERDQGVYQIEIYLSDQDFLIRI